MFASQIDWAHIIFLEMQFFFVTPHMNMKAYIKYLVFAWKDINILRYLKQDNLVFLVSLYIFFIIIFTC